MGESNRRALLVLLGMLSMSLVAAPTGAADVLLPSPPFPANAVVPGEKTVTNAKLRGPLTSARKTLTRRVREVVKSAVPPAETCTQAIAGVVVPGVVAALDKGLPGCVDPAAVAGSLCATTRAVVPRVFCEGTVPLPADLGGGFIPANPEHLKAELAIWTLAEKLERKSLACLRKAEAAVRRGGGAAEAVAQAAANFQSCRERAVAGFTSRVDKLAAKGVLADCVDGAAIAKSAVDGALSAAAETLCGGSDGLEASWTVRNPDATLLFQVEARSQAQPPSLTVTVATHEPLPTIGVPGRAAFVYRYSPVEGPMNTPGLAVSIEAPWGNAEIVPIRRLVDLLDDADLEGLDAEAEADLAAQVDAVTLGEVVLIQHMRANAYLAAARILLSLDPTAIWTHLGIVPPVDPSGPPPCAPEDVCFNKDFECSSIAPNDIEVSYRENRRRRTARISFLDCCLRHDVEFYCGGTRDDFHASNNRLIECVRNQITASPISDFKKGLLRAWWTLVFSATHLRYSFDDDDRGLGFCSIDGSDRNSPEESAKCLCRQQSCLCGGQQPVPLCSNPCRVNACTLPLPARFREFAWTTQPNCP